MEEQIINRADEINIRELIETIWRGKVIIAVITIVAILFSGVVSFFYLPKTYEARTVLMANPIDLNNASLGASNDLIEYLTKLPTMTIQTYLEQILTPEVLNGTIQTLNLRDSTGKFITAGSLRGRLAVRNIGGTNLLEILVTDVEPEQAAQIANAMAESFIAYITANTLRLGQQAVDLITEQLEMEEQNLNNKSKALADYWKDNRNIDVLKGEVSNLKSKLVAGQARLLELNQLIAASQEALRLLQAEVIATPGLNPDDFWFNVDLDDLGTNNQLNIGLGTDNLSQALLRIEINKLQSRLIADISEKTALDVQVGELDSSLTVRQIELTEEEYKFNALNRDMQMAQQAYDAYQQKYKDAMLTAASDIGKSSVVVTSLASVPEAPVSPNKMMNLIIAAFLGIILGVFVVLFRDYWRRSKPAAVTEKEAI